MDYLTLTLSFVAAIAAVVVAVYVARLTLNRDSLYEANRQYLDLAKLMIEKECLLEFYRAGTEEHKKYWDSLTVDQRKLYVFCEMYYCHFAYVASERAAGRISLEEWQLWDEYLSRLLRDENFTMFREVIKRERENFEEVLSDKILEQLRKPILPRGSRWKKYLFGEDR